MIILMKYLYNYLIRYYVIFAIFIVVIGLVWVKVVFASVTLTAATYSSTISADTNSNNGTGTFKTLTGPVIAEGSANDISTNNSTIILNTPTGFEFDTTVNSVTVTVSDSGTCTNPNKPLRLNDGGSGVNSLSV